MRRWILLMVVVFSCSFLKAQETDTIKTDGFTFSPSELSVQVGDTVVFDVGATHTATQVSKATWDADGTQALSGGFNFGSGESIFVPKEAGTIYYVCENHVSLGMKGKIIVSEPVGLNDFSMSKPELYPNPVTDMVNLRLSDPLVRIKLYDMSGEEVRDFDHFKQELNRFTIPVSDLHKGIYFVKMESVGRTYVLKFIKL